MAGDPGDGEKGQPQNQHKQDDIHAHKQVMERGVAFVGIENDRADGSGPGKQGHGDGDDGHRFTIAVVGLFFAEGDTTLLGMEHGYGHKQKEDATAHPERVDADPKKSEEEFTGQQGCGEDHQNRDDRGLGGSFKIFFGSIFRQRHDNGDGPDGIDDGHQGDKDLRIFSKINHDLYSL